jgi:SAM-dependent methyltransferase
MDVVTGLQEAEIKGITLEREGDWLRVIPGSPVEERFVLNGATFLARMAGTGYVPQSKLADAGLLIEDLGESEKVWDEIAFRRNCARLLLKLQELNIAHGDLTSKNIIVKDNCPIVVDWWQAKATDDPTPKKRPESDAFHLWTAAAELSPDTSRHLRRWLAIREHIGAGSLLDLGCADGDFCLFAASEREDTNIPIMGVDKDPEAIVRMSNLCEGLGVDFRVRDIMKIDDFLYDTVLLLSVWPYIYNRMGAGARQLLKRITQRAGQLIFETQLYGDGPGPNFLRTDQDVYEMLSGYGSVERLAQIPVHGRNAARSVWLVMR